MYSTVMNTDHPKQSAAMNHGRPPRGGKAVVWDGGEGREGGRSGCGVWECLELQGRDRVSGRSGGGVRRVPVLTFVVGFASRTPHRAISTSPSFTTCLTRRSGGEWRGGASPCQDFLGEAASAEISTRSFPRHDTRRRALRGSTTAVAAPIARGWHRPCLASSPHPRAISPSHACTSALYTVVP